MVNTAEKLDQSALKQYCINLRRQLHQYPDLSNHEENTARMIYHELQQFRPDQVITNVGGHGLLAKFKGKKKGNHVLFRAELDALPIHEPQNFTGYHSLHEGVSHKCGHDGHMAILMGLAALLHHRRPQEGSVTLLFQPAEETGEGALRMLSDRRLTNDPPDEVYALHNVPGHEKNKIYVKRDIFACASVGLEVYLQGHSAHAGEPEKASFTTSAVHEFLAKLQELDRHRIRKNDFKFTTITHIEVGTPSFGITPGEAVVRATLRSNKSRLLSQLAQDVEKVLQKISKKYKLQVGWEWREHFPETINWNKAITTVRKACYEAGVDCQDNERPFRWSEDFGHFTKIYPGAFFALGTGTESLDLHHPDYDFNDDCLMTGVNVFWEIIKQKVRLRL